MKEEAKMPGGIQRKLSLIASLIKGQRYDDALAPLRHLKGQIDLSKSASLIGYFHHLSAKVFFKLGEKKDALTNCEKALSFLRDTVENKLIADTQAMLGRIFLSLGNLKKAEMHLRDAISTYRRIGDQKNVIRTQNIVAQIYFMKSDFVKAKELLEDGLESSQGCKDATLKAILTANLGRVYTFLGEWDKAEKNLLANAEYHWESKAESNLCRDLLSLGYLYFLKRDLAAARIHYSRAQKLLETKNWVREQAIYHEYEGELAFNEGRLLEAESHYKENLPVIQKAVPGHDLINQTYRLLAELQYAKNEYDEALSSCERSLEVSLSLGDILEEGAVCRVYGQVYAAQNHKILSRKYFNRSISTLQVISARFELAKTYLEAGKAKIFDYYQRLGFLVDATREFENLRIDYYIAQANLATARLFLESAEWERVSTFLDRAQELFSKSGDNKGLIEVARIRQEALKARVVRVSSIPKEEQSVCPRIVTQNSGMLDILEEIRQRKDEDSNILLEGETGTGKDVLAKYIHYTSDRRDKRFIQITCSELNDGLLPNELFGHSKGAYNGADQDQPGFLEEADGGTLYLDHITDLPLGVQVKLLRFTEKKEITRLGETEPRRIDVRIISSTNAEIQKKRKDLSFREDLYYRLSRMHKTIPPLRERKEDIPLLIRHFLTECGADQELIESTENAKNLRGLLDHDWKGNLWELENVVKDMYAKSGGEKDKFAQFLRDFHRNGDEKDSKVSLRSLVRKFEKEKIEEALKKAKGVQTKAASMLGIHESVLRSKMKKFGMKNQD